ncbi:rhomboid family intramembrane serine protease [Pseudosulfitobacter koreensis]|uniref:Rhomboid family intramembrane serine protease n=1 Tax=Pseudosulfitobacter koreensis TaxID=2968472 RepID=A0ABT1Z3R1_9RHOB|nr:rhomboid family intramembrane serine protease [Pseudosulfitobacter koreense]MCR8827755.1 rhomboid family intramembrane serine protease [Pseudosulfitobacter koreense]
MSNPFTNDAGTRQSQAGAPGFMWALVGIMALIELVLSLSSSGLFGTQDLRWPAFLLGAFWQPLLSGGVMPAYPGQPVLMFVTYAFLHGGILHLVMNGVILLSLGKFVSAQIGAARTLAVLFAAAVGGAACFGLLSSSGAPMIGASGAVFGLIGLWQVMEYRLRRRRGLPVRPVVMGVLGLALVNVVLFMMLSGGLAWEAHLGGWIAGWLAAQSFARV